MPNHNPFREFLEVFCESLGILKLMAWAERKLR